MSATFDYLSVPLTCPNCGTQHPGLSTLEIDCQTKVRARPYLDALVPGQHYELLSDLADGGYWPTIDDAGRGPVIRVIDEWNCAACGLNYLWVKSHWRGGFLESARAVVLSEAELLETDYMTDMWFDLRQKGTFYADFKGMPVAELRQLLATCEEGLWKYRREEGLLGDGWHAKTLR